MKNSLMPIMALALVGALAQSYAWTPPERVDRKPADYVTYLNAVSVGRDGAPRIVWSECKHGTYYEKTMYAHRQADTWSIPVNISRDSGDIRTPAIVVDSSGRALVVWSEESYARMRYVRQFGDTWTAPKPCFQNNGITPRLAIDSRGRVHLLFEELTGQGGIWHSYYYADSDSWATPSCVASAPQSLGWSDLSVDGRDWLHAVWMNWATRNIDYSCFDGTQWSPPIGLPNPAPGTQATYPKIAVDSNDKPHVVWEESRIYYTYLSGDSWAAPQQVHEERGGRPLLASDSFSRLHVVWAWDSKLFYRARDTGWTEVDTLYRQVPPFTPLPGGLARRADRLHLVWRGDWEVLYSAHPLSAGIGEHGSLPAKTPLRVLVAESGFKLQCDLPAPGPARVMVCNIAGQMVAGLTYSWLDSGRNELFVPYAGPKSEVLFCRLRATGLTCAAKTVVVR